MGVENWSLLLQLLAVNHNLNDPRGGGIVIDPRIHDARELPGCGQSSLARLIVILAEDRQEQSHKLYSVIYQNDDPRFRPKFGPSLGEMQRKLHFQTTFKSPNKPILVFNFAGETACRSMGMKHLAEHNW
ncbi:predicted protein [Histoplasma capsulatum var. duboisii H88]|uniref:Predicted protein n=2 Tax=Ajellomyces capsulatus TaxID=5037 RepID=F0UD63_AJEC8|nr:predicted protein [Histoplasma capsulatum H143]EGC42658.1 predicted protein [Histoplasma capsulatum var. duboisii H88]